MYIRSLVFRQMMTARRKEGLVWMSKAGEENSKRHIFGCFPLGSSLEENIQSQFLAIMLSTTSILLPLLSVLLSDVHSAAIGPVVPVVETSSGPVRGGVNSRSPAVFEYLGVPYAQPPIGPLRFGKPVALEQPFESIDGTIPAKSCPQISVGLDDTYLNDVPEFTIGSNLTT